MKNIDYVIRYKEVRIGFFKVVKKYMYVIVEVKWYYYECFEHSATSLTPRTYYSLSMQKTDKATFTTLAEAEKELVNFKLNRFVKDTSFVIP